MTDIVMELLSNFSEVIIVHPYSRSEISNPVFGGARLILEQIRFLTACKFKVRVISLEEVGSLTSLIYKIQGNIRTKAKTGFKASQNSKSTRWLLNLFQVIASDIVSKVDIGFIMKAKYLLKPVSPPTILVYNYPYGAASFISLARNPALKTAIYQHNMEWLFFRERIGSSIIAKSLLGLGKQVELNNLRKADYIFCATRADQDTLIAEGIVQSKIRVWVPLNQQQEKTNLGIDIPEILKVKTKGKFVVGFVGSDFEPNVISVNGILHISKYVTQDVVFLIIGSVAARFGDKDYIPKNLIFTGSVRVVDDYLSRCNAFINPKTSSDTGIETKMFDYFKFNRPIITTEIGGRGFENFDNIIISQVEKMAEVINGLAVNRQGIFK